MAADYLLPEMQLITKYFNNLSPIQISRFASLDELYHFWNSRINVISRKDIDQLYLHHVLHSLAIARLIQFRDGSYILDAGTGGGFPGIPLAILFPDVDFLLADSIAKKILVVNAVIQELGLTNCKAVVSRVEKINQKFDFVVSRAVTSLPDFLLWTNDKISKKELNAMGNGILYLKGGNLAEELQNIKHKFQVIDISSFFSEEYFESKKIVHINLSGNN